jgi:hypothetical protein
MRPVWKLVLASVLFAGWIGYLVYLVVTARNPVVLSRPQLLVTDFAVKAHIDNPESNTVKVESVYWVRDDKKPPANGDITVANLDQCKGSPYYTGPGEYILPLQRTKAGEYLVAQIPRSPGYPPAERETAVRIYPDTAETRQQLERLKPQ